MLSKLIFLIKLTIILGYPLIEENQRERKEFFNFNGTNSTTRCPTWYLPTSSGCVCGSNLGPLIKCYGQEQVKVRVAYCMSFDEASQQTLVGNCPYVYRNIKKDTYVEQSKNVSQLNKELCGWANRTGFLCSHCNKGLGMSPITYSYTCVKCIGKTKGWTLYLFLTLVPSTIFFVIIVVCRVRTNSEKMNTMVCIFQIMVFYADKYPQTIEGIEKRHGSVIVIGAITIGGIWNLDFFRHVIPPFCISEHLSTLNAIAMEYIVAMYPLFLLLLTYMFIELHGRDYRIFQVLWLPLKWCLLKIPWKIEISHSIVDAFASILQLSYSKLIFVSFNLLTYVDKQNAKGEIVPPRVWYYDSEIEYLSKRHLPYFVLALVVLSLFVILPTLVLLLYPTKKFQTFLGLFPSINWHPLHAFADAFNGYYKNGTDGTKDYRYFGSFYFFLRLFFFLPAIISSFESAVLLTIVPFLGALFISVLRPYKDDAYNKLNTLYWSLCLFSQILSIYNLYGFRISYYILFFFVIFLFVHMTYLTLYELLLACCPAFLVKLKRKFTQLVSLIFNVPKSSSHQHPQSNGHSELEYSVVSKESEPDRIVDSANCLLLPGSMKISSYDSVFRA